MDIFIQEKNLLRSAQGVALQKKNLKKFWIDLTFRGEKLAKKKLTALDVLTIAIGRERDSALLYKKLSARVKNPLIRKKLKSLSKEEAEHERLLTGIYEKESGEKAPKKKASAKAKPDIDIDKAELVEVIEYAIKKEKAAFRFYRNYAKLIKDQSGRFMFEYLSTFEKGHQVLLEEELKILKRYPKWAENENLSGLTHVGP